MSTKSENPQHHLRFYIVMATLVVAAILVLLFLNNDKNGSLTSATIGLDSLTGKEEDNTDSTPTAQQILLKKMDRESKEVPITLTFNQIPAVREEAKITEIELRFKDLTTKINVNNDKLELNNLQEVIMKIKDFSGDIDVSEAGFSLDGTAKSIEVNDIALSAKGELEISFDNLDYDYLAFQDIDMDQLDIPVGDGELKAAEKLTYALEQDKLTLYFFNGKAVIDRGADTLLNLEGVIKGLSISGALLDLDVKG